MGWVFVMFSGRERERLRKETLDKHSPLSWWFCTSCFGSAALNILLSEKMPEVLPYVGTAYMPGRVRPRGAVNLVSAKPWE